MIKFAMSFIPKNKMIDLFTYSIESKKSIETVIDKVENACEKYNFSLVHQYAYHDIVSSKGFPIERKVYIYEICQAKVASMMLRANPYFSPFMPCRIAVYEDNNHCTISTQNMELMLDLVKKQTDLHKEAVSLFLDLKNMINELKE